MATESSAIVRFIELQRQQPIESVDVVSLPESSTDPFSPVRKRPFPLVVIGALLLFGGLAAGGVYLARDVLFGSGGSSPAAGAIAGLDNRGEADEQSPDRAVALDPIPQPSAVVEPLSADPEPEPEGAPASTSADTGFDLRVSPPGARVFLDGKELGIAPLRARNVEAGAHTIDIEGPEGYFSRRLEVTVVLDQPDALRVELSALDRTDGIKKLSKREARRQARQEARAGKREARRQARAERNAARAAAVAERAEKAQSKADPDPGSEKEELEALAALAAGTEGTLRLGAKPPCDIYIDGKNTGLKTPQRSIRLTAGKHSVKLVNPEHDISSSFGVKIAPGRTTTVIRDLSEKIK